MHLPLNTTSHLGEVSRLINDIVASGLPTRTVFVSHLTHDELARLATTYPDFTVRPRIGTDLWLGDRGRPVGRPPRSSTCTRSSAATPSATAAAALPKHGHIVVVSGGTAHGIGLEAPTGDQSLKARAATLARGRPGRRRLRALAVLDRRQAAALRRAAPHAGLDAVRARQARASRASARTSRSGSASPRPTSTASSSPDGVPQHGDHQPHQSGDPQQDRQPVGPRVVGDGRHERLADVPPGDAPS